MSFIKAILIYGIICSRLTPKFFFFFYSLKGTLNYIERHSVAGHVLTIINESQQKVAENVSVWYKGYYYKVLCLQLEL